MKFCLMIAVALLMLACGTKKNDTLVWSDEFDYTGTPDTARWSFDLGNNDGWGNNELQFYTNNSRNARVENGVLIVEAHKDSTEGHSFSSARIVSKLKGDWLHGRMEVKAKLPKGKGTWPAIWMLPTEWKYGGWPASGEIDIMEHVGFDPGVIHGTIHCELYNHVRQTQKEGTISVPDAQDAFHAYAIDWTKDKMDFLVDGKIYHTVLRDPKDDFKGWPFDQPFYLIINQAVGGNWGGQQGVDESIWPQRLEVEYVRIYQ